MLSERKKGFLLRCKDSSVVNVLAMKTHEPMDPGGNVLPGPRVTMDFGQCSNSICGGDLAGAMGGASASSPSPSKYRRTDAGSVMKAMILIFP